MSVRTIWVPMLPRLPGRPGANRSLRSTRRSQDPRLLRRELLLGERTRVAEPGQSLDLADAGVAAGAVAGAPAVATRGSRASRITWRRSISVPSAAKAIKSSEGTIRCVAITGSHQNSSSSSAASPP